MANHYTLFSFAIPALTRRERGALAVLLRPGENLVAKLFELDEGEVGFVAEIDGDDLWIHSDEDGTPEHAAEFVQFFLARYRPDDSIGFEWANTSSRPILDSYGGGAVFITATEQRWMSTGKWLSEQQPGAAGGRITDTGYVADTEVIVGLNEMIDHDLEGFLDMLDELEAAARPVNEEGFYEDEAGMWELGPLSETDYTLVRVGEHDSNTVVLRVTGTRQATFIEPDDDA